MNEEQALQSFYPPWKARPNKPMGSGGVMQIHVTRACALACRNCTQGSNLRGKNTFMTPEQFEKAIASLEGYPYLIALFGGQPTLSPWFPEYCSIMRNKLPINQRGLWTNALNGWGAECRKTFYPVNCNLNVHTDQQAFEEFRRDWPEANIIGHSTDSRHGPVYVAMKDVIPDEGERWRLISDCDIARNWSSMIGLFRGELRGWICEVMGAQSILHQDEPEYPDTGIPVVDWSTGEVSQWWKLPLKGFANQVRKHCHECGVPLRGYGLLSQDDTGSDQVSAIHASIYKPKRKGHEIEVVTGLQQLGVGRLQEFTSYIQNGRK